jgi:hypothetical protein
MTLDGPIDGPWFQAYIEQVLAPELRPGDIVIMDNLGSHKGPRIKEAIDAAGATLRYLPAYSPDLNQRMPGPIGIHLYSAILVRQPFAMRAFEPARSSKARTNAAGRRLPPPRQGILFRYRGIAEP